LVFKSVSLLRFVHEGSSSSQCSCLLITPFFPSSSGQVLLPDFTKIKAYGFDREVLRRALCSRLTRSAATIPILKDSSRVVTRGLDEHFSHLGLFEELDRAADHF